MRRWNLGWVLGACALAACHDSLPGPSGPSSSEAGHIDSLSAQASAASQPNRVAALDIALHALADGGVFRALQLTTGPAAGDTATYIAIAWSRANLIVQSPLDSISDSLMVLVAWRNSDADTILVVRQGHPGLGLEVEPALATLGLTGNLPQDSLASAALVTDGNFVALADSGTVSAQFGELGAGCSFITVTQVTNDSNTDGYTCDLVLVDWAFSLRISPYRYGLTAGVSPGVVLLH